MVKWELIYPPKKEVTRNLIKLQKQCVCREGLEGLVPSCSVFPRAMLAHFQLAASAPRWPLFESGGASVLVVGAIVRNKDPCGAPRVSKL